MLVTRSALASQAARSASTASAPSRRAMRPGEQLDALDALQLAAELVVIDHACELRHALFQPLLAVLLVEKARILQARPDHALVAFDDILRVGEAHVADDEEFVGQFPGGVEQRKIFLVLPHGEDQAFLRHVEKIGSNSPT